MKLIINDLINGSQTVEVDAELSSFYQVLGKILGETPVSDDTHDSNTINISCEYGTASYTLTYRSGTRLISCKNNHIHLQQEKAFPEKYLIMINSDHNNYKFYHLKQDFAGGPCIASWGRIGANAGEMWGEKSCQYDADMFWPKYFEKTAKGYEDKTEFYIVSEEPKQETKPKPKKKTAEKNVISARLFTQLKSFANQAVQEAIANNWITGAMVEESKRLLGELYTATDLQDFNDKLMQLMAVCPRKVANVNTLIAHDTTDFARIVNREESLVNAMRAVKRENSSEEDFGKDIEVFEATDEQKEQVLKHLSPDLQTKVKTIYRVIPKKQQKIFDEYCKKNQITTIKQLWHGSRNENWLSIIKTSLSLNPNAKITGKMFGNGIYFAPKSTKSWGYTSAHGSYWARGNSHTAFMALYATAYGNPLDCECAHQYTKSEVFKAGKNCVHAHAGSQLRNDEIIYYDEAAMVLNYVVEFEV